MGGGHASWREPRSASFATTRWTLVATAASRDAPEARAALQELCKAYWWPLYAYLRRVGIGSNDAADLVQGLFAELIEKGRFARADPDRCKFRCWLLSALKFYLSHWRERELAAKRGGNARVLALDWNDAERRWSSLSNREEDPERMFDRAWANEVLQRAFKSLEAEYAAGGKATLYAALEPRLLTEPKEGGLRTLAAQLGMSEAAVKTAAFRMRKSLRDAIRAELASTLREGAGVDEELRALFYALSAESKNS